MPEIQVPFPGFYESILSGAIDRAEEMTVESLRENEDYDIFEYYQIANILFDHTNYTAVHLTIAEAWVKEFANYVAEAFDLRLGLEFVEMTSPREYNFTTDRVFAKISMPQLRELFELVDKRRLDEECERWLKSRSGFISHYDHRWRNWGPLEDWDYNQLGMLLHALDLGEDWQWEMLERLNEGIDRAVEAGQDWGKIEQELDEAVLEARGEIEPDSREFPIGVGDPAEYVRQYVEMNHLK